jgi:hypothetical protein
MIHAAFHFIHDWKTVVLLGVSLGAAGMLGLKAISTKLANSRMVYLRWIAHTNRMPIASSGLKGNIQDNELLHKLTDAVRDPLARAILFIEGPVGVGKGYTIHKFAYDLTDGRMPFRLMYHWTGLTIPCLCLRITSADKPWKSLIDLLEGGFLTVDRFVIQNALKRMKRLPHRPVVIFEDVQKMFSGPKLDVTQEAEDFIYFWQNAAEEGVATVIFVTSEQSVFWRMRRFPTMDSDARLRLLPLGGPQVEDIQSFMSSEGIDKRLFEKGRGKFTEEEIDYYARNIGDYRTIKGYLTPEETSETLVHYIDSLIHIQKCYIQDFIDENIADKAKIIYILSELMASPVQTVSKKEGELSVFRKLVASNFLRRKELTLYTWHRKVVRAGAELYLQQNQLLPSSSNAN